VKRYWKLVHKLPLGHLQGVCFLAFWWTYRWLYTSLEHWLQCSWAQVRVPPNEPTQRQRNLPVTPFLDWAFLLRYWEQSSFEGISSSFHRCCQSYIPRHRRNNFFANLVDVLGTKDFLAPVTTLMLEKMANRIVRQPAVEVPNTLSLPVSIFQNNSYSLQHILRKRSWMKVCT